jgi:hypothetical protein
MGLADYNGIATTDGFCDTRAEATASYGCDFGEAGNVSTALGQAANTGKFWISFWTESAPQHSESWAQLGQDQGAQAAKYIDSDVGSGPEPTYVVWIRKDLPHQVQATLRQATRPTGQHG